MMRSGRVIFALAVSMTLLLVGAGVVVASMSESQLGATAPEIVVGGSTFASDVKDVEEMERVQQRQRACRGLSVQDRFRICERDCSMEGECTFDCIRAAAGAEGASGQSRMQAGRSCFAGGVAPVEQEQEDPRVDISCFRCDREPLNEYPPQSPWYTGD